jgi:16S rRNA (cytosine967-C5)-methyltransferase
MAVSPARAAAFEILLRVEQRDSYASELLHSARISRLTPADHSLATELVMGVLRWRSLLDHKIEGVSSQKLERLDAEVRTALRMGVYQLHFLSRVPARAAIFESVELVKEARKRSAAPFVNAVLRKIGAKPGISEGIASAVDSTALSRVSAHPEWMVRRWVERYGLETARQICRSNQSVPDTAVHIDDEATAAELSEAGVYLEPGLLLSAARRVRSGDVTKTQAYREGRITIQDEASQLVALVVGHGDSILDCCAAPGSKTALISRRNPHARVVATELHPHRARLLRRRMRNANVSVVVADARSLPFGRKFDRILADVPCSGTGTLARNPEIKWRLRAEDLPDLQKRQTAILKAALAQLSPGGQLVYSTCSLEPEENEAVVEAALEGTTEFARIDVRGELDRFVRAAELAWGDVDSLVVGPFLRTLPGAHPCDGFFAAIVERRG